MQGIIVDIINRIDSKMLNFAMWPGAKAEDRKRWKEGWKKRFAYTPDKDICYRVWNFFLFSLFFTISFDVIRALHRQGRQEQLALTLMKVNFDLKLLLSSGFKYVWEVFSAVPINPYMVLPVITSNHF